MWLWYINFLRYKNENSTLRKKRTAAIKKYVQALLKILHCLVFETNYLISYHTVRNITKKLIEYQRLFHVVLKEISLLIAFQELISLLKLG